MSNLLKNTLKKDIPVIIKPGEIKKPEMEPQKAANPNDASFLERFQEEMRGMRSKAQDEIDKAKAEAGEILAKALLDAEAIKQEARSEGHEKGYAEGVENGRSAAYEQMGSSIEDAAKRAERILTEAEGQAKRMILDANDEIIDIVKATIQKALCLEAMSNPEAIVAIVKEALDKVRDHDQIVIRVNPENFEPILEAKHELQKIIGREHDLNIIVDKTIAGGGCVIDTSNGSVDARLDTKMELLLKTIEEVKEIEKDKKSRQIL